MVRWSGLFEGGPRTGLDPVADGDRLLVSAVTTVVHAGKRS